MEAVRTNDGDDMIRKKLLLPASAVVAGMTVGFVGVEVTLRLAGLTPWRSTPVETEPVLYRPDSVLGWRTTPGRHRYGPYVAEGDPIEVTILPDGSRDTGTASGSSARTLALVGGSFTFGQAVSDRKTFAWKLQERLPHVRIKNYGAGGYGTAQAILLLEELFASSDPPEEVIYGFVVAHDGRNIAHPGWLKMLSQYSRGAMVATPYCTLDGDGKLEWHSPVAWRPWPLARVFASVDLMQEYVVSSSAKSRVRQASEVTRRLLLEMRELSREHGARLRIAMLHGAPKKAQRYEHFLAQKGIEWIDCTGPYPLPDEFRVPGEGHPNAARHTAWARCIAETMDRPMKSHVDHQEVGGGRRDGSGRLSHLAAR